MGGGEGGVWRHEFKSYYQCRTGKVVDCTVVDSDTVVYSGRRGTRVSQLNRSANVPRLECRGVGLTALVSEEGQVACTCLMCDVGASHMLTQLGVMCDDVSHGG